MLAPSPFSASSSLSILRSAKLSRTPPVGLIRAVCLCEAAGALGAAGARHCQWTESLTLPGSRTQTHAPRSPCYCFHLNPFLPASFACLSVCVCVPSSPPIFSLLSPSPAFFLCPRLSLFSVFLLFPVYRSSSSLPLSPSHPVSLVLSQSSQREGQQHQEEISHKGNSGCCSNWRGNVNIMGGSHINQLKWLDAHI